MTDRVEFGEAELALIREALQDAMAFRDARSHVMKRMGAMPPADVDRRLAKDYEALLVKLQRP